MRVNPVHGDRERLRLHARLAAEVGIEPERVFVGENGLPSSTPAKPASASRCRRR